MNRNDLVRLLLAGTDDSPVVATTPHGTYTFDIVEVFGVENLDRGRQEIQLRLRELQP